MYLLIEVAGYINTLPTIGMVMLTAVIGVFLLKRQGLATLTRGMARLDSGEIPAQEMAEGLLLAISGALLVTPGFITDTVGFLLLLPPSRAVMARHMLSRVELKAASGAQFSSQFQSQSQGQPPPHPNSHPQPDQANTIEGEFQRKS
jgi:UPF0716 protein FxsA